MDLQTFIALNKLYADYAATIDAEDWDGWTEYFVDDCEYKVQPRENFERGFPLATMWFISKGMLKDRAFGISETLFHDPYYQRHVVGAPRILSAENGEIQSEANYAVFRTKLNGESTVFNVGRYIDRIVQTDEGLKFKSRFCIYDSEMIANSLIYPV
ncbi:aromatic-ring-hydroxylating dioxygenase subunit beta [Neopusillimonas maritima]|jgi:salicylate 5-hydroxylase small subunit|uniref:Salicylate hydroxylase n=1 Tax=Neopusillimonas maritima TaxID=2026239 RepID=A0A3A1YY97_9BURK|nr:aromatic-ring-hydroxylating dioxygenase subunit beta [Neopusillimonas maritima]MBF22487.1 salicylate hydroxylase [Pusillimonas sp.]RII82306.1 salicylate hydroxylase [Neopusillimonas maritima]RIY42289.1 salicylate hydroxylase [Neopusillimonas maritima]|tara:strand:+ start:2054 stop:2524 length:471 start_codon:yes stop_codon:yes gene_type:complete